MTYMHQREKTSWDGPKTHAYAPRLATLLTYGRGVEEPGKRELAKERIIAVMPIDISFWQASESAGVGKAFVTLLGSVVLITSNTLTRPGQALQAVQFNFQKSQSYNPPSLRTYLRMYRAQLGTNNQVGDLNRNPGT